jgi:uncharacterized repeat protein (TIGR01451 family)
MRRYIIIFIIISLSINSSSAFFPNDIEWGTATSSTLHKGGTITNGEYMVKAVNFAAPVQGHKELITGNIVPDPIEPSVLLELYKNGVFMKQIVFNMQSEPYIDLDYEVMVSVTGFLDKNAREWVFEYYDPSATVALSIRGKPKLDITITTDKDTYTSNGDNAIVATYKVTNNGEARAKSVDLNFNPGDLKPRSGNPQDLHKNFLVIEKGGTQSFDVILEVPNLLDEKTFTITGMATGIDAKDLKYNWNASKTITVSPKQNYFTISKGMRDRMYLQNIVAVTIVASNGGMYDIYNIHVNDSLNPGFELRSTTPLQWDIPVLKPGQEWSTVYSMKPMETNLNGFTIPASSAQFTVNGKPYSASSTTTSLVVNGPKIVLNKSVLKQVVNMSEDVTVTVSINNIGNIVTKAEVKDSLPEGANLVSGPLTLDPTFLELNIPQGFSYVIRIDKEGEYDLPKAEANYTGVEYKGTTRSVLSSNGLVITVVDPSKVNSTPVADPDVPGSTSNQNQKVNPGETTTLQSTTTPEPTPTPITPGFGVILAISIILLAARFRRK